MAIKKRYGNLSTAEGVSRSLGRGLDALISTEAPQTQGTSTICEISLANIQPNPDQPRRVFDDQALDELAASIREIGIIQPITLRERDKGQYEIIAGERRWRACQRAGVQTIPAYVRKVSDETMMEMALVENIQRQDLNAIEVALAYQHLLNTTGLTQERVAERVGKSRAQVANFMRLLRLPAEVQMALQSKQIEVGAARALLGLDSPSEQVKMFREIQKNKYNTRQVEELVNAIKAGETTAKQTAVNKQKLSAIQGEIEKQLVATLKGIKVKVSCSTENSGKIVLPFKSAEELEQLMQLLRINKDNG